MLARTLTLTLCMCCATTGIASAQAPESPPPAQPVELRTFVACPIYRDTDAGRKSGCWLADDSRSGVRYDISLGPVKPQIGRQVLVEGVTSSEPRTPCGGDVLTPIRIAVLQDHCPSQLIPAETYPGRPYKSPPEQLRPASEPRTLPPPPYTTQVFTIYFELGRDFLVYQYAEMILEKIMLYAKASQAKQVRIEGFAATDPYYVQGRAFREPLELAQARAQMVAEALRRLGVPDTTLTVDWFGAPMPAPDLEAGKLPEASKRRVVITITP
jgi:outer membrane protein OmpA-like peptidoglycan-associated protein